MESPSHFFSDSVDLDANGLFAPIPDSASKPDNMEEPPLALFAPSTPSHDMFVNIATKTQEPKSGTWVQSAVDNERFGGTELPPTKTEGQAEMEDAITVAVPSDSTASTRRGSSTKSSISRRFSSARSASTAATPPPAPVNTKKRKAASTVTSDPDEQPQGTVHKRQKFLQRNRVAATKCRQKKKQWVADLEEKSINLENQKACLEEQIDALVEEIKGLKCLVMSHAKCNEPSIDNWLEGEARRFVMEHSRFAPVSQPMPFAIAPGLPYGYATHEAVSQGSPVGTTIAYPGSDLDGPSSKDRRRGSVVYSHTSTAQSTSPVDNGFAPIASPQFKIEDGDEEVNLDHMPDSMFCSDQTVFFGLQNQGY